MELRSKSGEILNIVDFGINADFEIPWAGGTSVGGATVYLDRRIPRYTDLPDGRRRENWKYLARHESSEFARMALGHKYQPAHEGATEDERDLVIEDGFDWPAYQADMLEFVKELESFNTALPADFNDQAEKDTREWARYEKIESLKHNRRDNMLPVGKVIRMPCMRSGVVQYKDEKVLVTKNALDAMSSSAHGIPIIIEHPDSPITHENIDKLPVVGRVSGLQYNDLDECWYADFIVDDEAAVKLLEDGYGVSTAWYPDQYAGGGTYNNVVYDRELLSGKYEHLAIVARPRYEMAKNPIFVNSKGGQTQDTMSKINISNTRSGSMIGKFLKKIVSREEIKTNAGEEMFVEIDGQEIGLADAIEQIKSAKLMLNGTYEYDVDGVKVSVGDLIAAYKTLKKNADDDEEKAKKEKEDKEKADKEKKENDEKAEKEKADKEAADKEAADKKEAAKKNGVDEETEASLMQARFNAIEEAYQKGDMTVEDNSACLSLHERAEIGARLYGSKK